MFYPSEAVFEVGYVLGFSLNIIMLAAFSWGFIDYLASFLPLSQDIILVRDILNCFSNCVGQQKSLNIDKACDIWRYYLSLKKALLVHSKLHMYYDQDNTELLNCIKDIIRSK